MFINTLTVIIKLLNFYKVRISYIMILFYLKPNLKLNNFFYLLKRLNNFK